MLNNPITSRFTLGLKQSLRTVSLMNFKYLLILVLLGSTFLLAGCRGEVRVENITVTNLEAMKHTGATLLAGNTSVESVFVNEGMDLFGVNPQKYRAALTASLGSAKLLAHDGKGLYKLKAHLVRTTVGFSTNSVTVQYTLIRKHDNKEIYSKLIFSTGTAWCCTWAAASEPAIKNNIAMLIDKLYKIDTHALTDGEFLLN